jgi:hypothetical protein
VAVTLVALAATLAGAVTMPAVAVETMETVAVGEKEVPAALMLTERLTVPAASATKVMEEARASEVRRAPEMLHW